MKTLEEIKSNLPYFIGTNGYYKSNFHCFKWTDGVNYLAEVAECFWLLDFISANLGRLDKNEFQSWTVKKIKSKVYDVEIVGESEDFNGNKKYVKKKTTSDFPLDEIKLFYRDGVLMLTSEY